MARRAFPAIGWFLPMLGVTVGAGPAPATQAPKAHPRLVSAASTRCETCHEALFQGKAQVHAPAREDCTTCHDVQVTETGTAITLTAEGTALCLACHLK